MVFRSKNQFTVVKKNEKEFNSKFIRGNPKIYIISEILDKKIENNKTFYLVRWKGFKKEDATWEHAKTLDRTDALRKLKRDFNDEND
jgi:transposase-like protein